DRKAVVLLQLGARLREGLIGGEVRSPGSSTRGGRAAAVANIRAGSPSPRARKDAPVASRTDIAAPGLLFRRISYASGLFFTLAMHLRSLANLTLRRLDPTLGPTAQRLPSHQTHLIHDALFRSVGFLQFAPAALNRQHDRGHPLPETGMRSQSRNQSLVAQLQPRHPQPPAKSMQTQPTLHRFESHPAFRADFLRSARCLSVVAVRARGLSRRGVCPPTPAC